MGQRFIFFFFQAEDGIRVPLWARGLGDVYKCQEIEISAALEMVSANVRVSEIVTVRVSVVPVAVAVMDKVSDIEMSAALEMVSANDRVSDIVTVLPFLLLVPLSVFGFFSYFDISASLELVSPNVSVTHIVTATSYINLKLATSVLV